MNLSSGVIEIHSHPTGDLYLRQASVGGADVVRLIAFPDAEIRIGDILR